MKKKRRIKKRKKQYCSVYLTASSREEAEKLAHALLDKHLVACVNFLPVLSWYWWQGKVDRSEEVAMIAKTEKSKFSGIEKLVHALHSYEVPCLVQWPIERGTVEYLGWVTDSLAGKGRAS